MPVIPDEGESVEAVQQEDQDRIGTDIFTVSITRDEEAGPVGEEPLADAIRGIDNTAEVSVKFVGRSEGPRPDAVVQDEDSGS